MVKPRASIFEEAEELDVSAFAPKTVPDANAPPPEQVRAVAEAANFRSREPRPVKPAAPPKHSPRRYRTGSQRPDKSEGLAGDGGRFLYRR